MNGSPCAGWRFFRRLSYLAQVVPHSSHDHLVRATDVRLCLDSNRATNVMIIYAGPRMTRNDGDGTTWRILQKVIHKKSPVFFEPTLAWSHIGKAIKISVTVSSLPRFGGDSDRRLTSSLYPEVGWKAQLIGGLPHRAHSLLHIKA